VDNFEDRLKSQKELHIKLDAIFGENESINLQEFTSIIKNKNSDIFLFILVFLYEHRPFSAETVRNLENIKKSPRLSSRIRMASVLPPVIMARINPHFTACCMA
jgi:hypothetical protein